MTIAILAVLALGVAGVIAYGNARWRARGDALRARLAVAAGPVTVATYDPQQIAALPAPVQRYFRAVLRPGQPIIGRASITWQGQFNLGRPGRDNWKPFTATQVFVPATPGFVWDARIVMAPAVAVLVRDGFVSGVGSMHGAVLGLWPVVDSEGSAAIASGALQRYLGEAAWLPTALLPSQCVTWAAIDDARALATICSGSTTASVEFRFDDDGLIHAIFVVDRLYDNGKQPPAPHPWQGRMLHYQEQDGMTVPSEAVAEWLLPGGTFAYWRARPTHVEYDYLSR